MRVLIVTSETARPIIERILSSFYIEEARPEIVALPVPAIGILSVETIARMLARHARDKLGRADIVVFPGLSRGDLAKAREILGVRVVRGPRDPGYLPLLLGALARGEYPEDVDAPFEDVLGYGVEDLPTTQPEEAFRIGRVSVPKRGPPLVLFAEIPYSVPVSRITSMVSRFEREGADIIVLGSRVGLRDEELVERYRLAREASSKPIICEAPSLDVAEHLVGEGCEGVSLSAHQVLSGERLEWARRVAVIIGSRDVAELGAALGKLREVGAEAVLLDPVVGVPLIDFSSTVERYRRTATLAAPLLFSAANALEELSADPHGGHLLLASLAAEFGASAYLVVEDSYKSIHSVAEAKAALTLVARAVAQGRPPNFEVSPLLVLKQSIPPPSFPAPEDAIVVREHIPPRLDPVYFTITVDYSRGLIVVTGRRGRWERSWAGTEPLSLARAIISEVEISSEHAAYLGYELHKAYLALRLGKTYLQDSDVIVPPWEMLSDDGEG